MYRTYWAALRRPDGRRRLLRRRRPLFDVFRSATLPGQTAPSAHSRYLHWPERGPPAVFPTCCNVGSLPLQLSGPETWL
ncbi:hypothetical protein Ga0074812_1049 [Parafrankia irregularis]|uniref:Uncharacterized protein n=1 Tax=Parafrankia irregularis TaxID=795642 RepID=A0A0S4QHG7_9ACTN|nr:hypothetical protein Ga0074812_1049 [Parafrankia irregularis]